MRFSTQAAGVISFNAAVFEALGRPERVVLLCDEKRGAVAIRAASSGDGTSYAVGRNGENQTVYRVSAKGLCKQVGIWGMARRYPVRVFREGVVGIVLGDTPT